MQCCIEGCAGEVRYKGPMLCQKHYFRVRRNGTTDVVRKVARPRYEDDRGYQYLHMPGHPLLAKGQSYVAEHRAVLYAAIGDVPMCCEICQKSLSWQTCDVDHIDENPRNNERANLRPTCLRCNVWRSMPPAWKRNKKATAITYEGETKTPSEWSKDPRVNLSGAQIRRRKSEGMADEQALFAPKKTHNGNPSEASERRMRNRKVASKALLDELH